MSSRGIAERNDAHPEHRGRPPLARLPLIHHRFVGRTRAANSASVNRNACRVIVTRLAQSSGTAIRAGRGGFAMVRE